MSQQAAANLAQLRSELELVIAKYREMQGAINGLKGGLGMGGGGGGNMGENRNDPASWEAVFANKNAPSIPEGSGFYAPGGGSGGPYGYDNYSDQTWSSLPSAGGEDAFAKAMSRRRWVAFAGQVNAVASIFMKSAGVDQDVAQNLTSGVSNVISSISWIYTANVLLTKVPGLGGYAMVALGTALIANSWIEYFKKINETDPIYQIGGYQKATVVNGSVTYN